MSNNELTNLLEYIEKEKGVHIDEIIELIKSSVISANKKMIGKNDNLDIKINKQNGEITVNKKVTVVHNSKIDELNNDDCIDINEAIKIDPNVKIGDIILIPIQHKDFGRIAVKIAKQAISQKLKKVEKDKSCKKFMNQIGEIVSGTVKKIEHNNIIVDFQNTDGILYGKNKIYGDIYSPGDIINTLLIDVDSTSFGPTLILSRTDVNFVRKLFEREVPEIRDEIVYIKNIAREPGIRTKISVSSTNSKIDPVGSCVGMKGSRIKSIMSELNNEKIDIIRYDDDFEKYVSNVLYPAVVKKITIYKNDEENVTNLDVCVIEDHVKLAIGKNWQNVRLCEKILDVKLNIIPFEE